MRGGEDEEVVAKIFLAKLPIPHDGYDANYNIKESLREQFFATYKKLSMVVPRTERERNRAPVGIFKITKISETADGVNLLPQPDDESESDDVICYFKFPTPPSESYVLSSGHLNPIYVELGPSKSKYTILEIK
jgi:hypothetical protein